MAKPADEVCFADTLMCFIVLLVILLLSKHWICLKSGVEYMKTRK